MSEQFDRGAPLPEAMQGRWIDVDDPSGELRVEGGEVRYRGNPVDYDFKVVGEEDDALTVDLKVNDPAREDTFQRENITGLVIDPEGDLHGFNVKFASQFVRAE
jgi:hypothetical protein